MPGAVGGALPDPDGLVAAAGGEERAGAGARGGVPGKRPHAVGVARQAVGLPQLHRAAVHGPAPPATGGAPRVSGVAAGPAYGRSEEPGDGDGEGDKGGEVKTVKRCEVGLRTAGVVDWWQPSVSAAPRRAVVVAKMKEASLVKK